MKRAGVSGIAAAAVASRQQRPPLLLLLLLPLLPATPPLTLGPGLRVLPAVILSLRAAAARQGLCVLAALAAAAAAASASAAAADYCCLHRRGVVSQGLETEASNERLPRVCFLLLLLQLPLPQDFLHVYLGVFSLHCLLLQEL